MCYNVKLGCNWVMKDELRKDDATRNRVLKLAWISESALRELVSGMAVGENASIDCLAAPGEIQIRLTVCAGSAEIADKLLATISEKINDRLREYIFCCDGEVIEDLLGMLLRQKGLTIALAESCTGGLIAARLTNTPGSSEYFKGGVVSYTNELKENFLGVPPDVLEEYGAVSGQTASAMAEGIRNRASSDIGLSVTGIAGPGGDTPDKPLGLVYIGLSTASGVLCRRYIFPGNRTGVRQGAVNMALNIVRRFLS
jgi:nicotinamide-nucleotide amidase